MDSDSVKALVFDTFGTVVDWRTSVSRDLAAFGARKGIQADWLAFADAWRAGYKPGMDTVRSGQRPWANIDVLPGLRRLKQRYIISTFSNGSVPCLVNMAKHAGLPWDAIYSADIVRHFKPDPEVYLGVIGFFDLPPEQLMLVAAHNGDLRHARSHGMRTAYIQRPTEYGPAQSKDLGAEDDWDVIVPGIDRLADVLLGSQLPFRRR